MELRELFQNLVIDELSHVFDADIRLADQSFRSDHNLIFNDAVLEVALLLYVELYVVKVTLFDDFLLQLLLLSLFLLPLVLLFLRV